MAETRVLFALEKWNNFERNREKDKKGNLPKYKYYPRNDGTMINVFFFFLQLRGLERGTIFMLRCFGQNTCISLDDLYRRYPLPFPGISFS